MSTRDRDGLHRRPNKLGSIWYFYYRGVDGRWHEKSTGTANYSEARQKRLTELEKIRRGELPAEVGKLTMEKAATLWQGERRSLHSLRPGVLWGDPLYSRGRERILCRRSSITEIT